MRSDRVPDTPVFWEQLEAGLRSDARRRSSLRLPVSTMAIRALRDAGSYALHVALAVGIASVLLLGAPGTTDDAHDAVSADTTIVSYVRQYRHGPASPADTARLARDLGYEVTVVRTFVPDRDADGKVVAVSHAGTTTAGVPGSGVARGPMLIIVGSTIAVAGSIAT